MPSKDGTDSTSCNVAGQSSAVASHLSPTFDWTPHVERASKGDGGSLAVLYSVFSPLVLQTAYMATGSVADAEEVLQDTFLGLPEALTRFDRGNFPGWLRRLARNRALTLVRTSSRRDRRAFHAVGRQPSEDASVTRLAIEEALGRMNPQHREVFLLRVVGGLTHAEIGCQLGITENLAQVRYHRAVATVRKHL